MGTSLTTLFLEIKRRDGKLICQLQQEAGNKATCLFATPTVEEDTTRWIERGFIGMFGEEGSRRSMHFPSDHPEFLNRIAEIITKMGFVCSIKEV